MPKGPSFQPAAEPESPAVSTMTDAAGAESPAAYVSLPAEVSVAEGASPPAGPGLGRRWPRILPAVFGAATVVVAQQYPQGSPR